MVSLLSERGATKQREQEFSEKGTLVRDQRWNAGGDPVSDESFYLNGQPLSKAVYGVDGDPRLIEITEFHDNGQRAAVGRYVSTDRFRKQNAIGTAQRFSESGTLIAESVYDDKGRITRERTWDASGKLERDEEVFEDGSRKAYAESAHAGGRQSSLMPAALMMGPQRFDSSRDSAANCCGIPGIASMPKSAKRFITAGVLKARLSSVLSRVTTAGGIARRAEDALEREDLGVGHADFCQRRHVGQELRAGSGPDREHAHLLALDDRKTGGQVKEHARHLAAHHVGHCRGGATVRNVRDEGARPVLEHLHREVMRRAVAGRRIVDLAGVRFHVGEEGLDAAAAGRLSLRRGRPARHPARSRDPCGDYTLPLDPGPRARFGGFTTEGDLAFDAKHVGVLARFRRGELYDSRKVDDLREAMVATSLFSTVSVEPVQTGERAEDGTEYVNILVRQDAGPAALARRHRRLQHRRGAAARGEPGSTATCSRPKAR